MISGKALPEPFELLALKKNIMKRSELDMFLFQVLKSLTYLRITVPIFYEDAAGPQEREGSHSLLLPHEIVGALHDFPKDMMVKLIGGQGVSW